MLEKFRVLGARLRGLFSGRSSDREFEAEVGEHIELLAERYIGQGMAREEARAAARRQFGNATLVHEHRRELQTFLAPTVLWRDVVYILRRMSHAPVFALAAILSIGLGIGANATIFSMVSKFVLRTAPVTDPDRLLAIHLTHDGERCCNSLSWPLYTDVREQSKSFTAVAAYHDIFAASIGGSGNPERVWGQAATVNFFDVAQPQMTFGRGFLPSEERAPVVVLSYGLWHRRFSGDPNILGKTISLSGHPFTVIGITPPGFHGLDLLLLPEFWVPLDQLDVLTPEAQGDRTHRDWHWIQGVGRLAPGVTGKQATEELAVLAQRLANTYPSTDKGQGFYLDRAGSLPARSRSVVLLFLTVLSVVVLLVLGIAGANVANLLLAQAMGRQKEMSVRLALGATRLRLLRQLLMESLLLAFTGGALGVLLSVVATRGLNAFHLPIPVPLDVALEVDWRVLLYSFLLSTAAGLFFGAIPAWVATRPLMINALKGEDALARPGRRWSLRNTLIIGQIAMSVVLLSATGLFLRSLQHAASINVGFRTEGLLMMSVDPQVHRYSAEQTIQFFSQVQEQVSALPGVLSATWTDQFPLSGSHRSDGFSVPGRKIKYDESANVELYMATENYFETLGLNRLSGRDFGRENPNGQKVAIVNQSFVEKFFPDENPLGQIVSGGGVNYQIIGVVQNSKARSLDESPRPVLYRALNQTVSSNPSGLGYSLVVHLAGNREEIAKAIRHDINSRDPHMAIYNMETIEEHLRSALFLPRFTATLFGTFGLVGLTLAAVGLYGVMNYTVSRRTREIGIRMAMGAPSRTVQRMVVRQGMILTFLALAIGFPVAFVTAKFANSFLYGVHPHDLVTFMAVPLFLALVAFLACWLPSRRAAKVNPQTVLRYE